MNIQPTYEELADKVRQMEKAILKTKQVEEAEQPSGMICGVFYDGLPLPYHSMNEDGYILQVNRLWLSALDYERKEVIGRHFSDFLHPDRVDLFKENFPKFKAAGEIRDVEFEMIRKDGASIWVSFNGNIVRDSGRFKHTHCVFNDITAQKRVEEKILRERTFSDAAMNSLPGIFYLFDQTGKFLRWNKNFERVFEYSPEEIGRLSPLDLFAGPDKLRVQERIQEAFDKGASSVEAELVSKSGKQKSWYFTGHTIQFEDKTCIIGMGVDISERRQAECAIVESEKRYRLLAEQSIQGIDVLHGMPPVIAYVNPTWTRIFGYDSDEALSLDSEQIWDLVHPDDRDFVRERNRDRLLGRSVEQRYEFRIIRKDGNIRWVEVFANIIEIGTIPSSQALYVDITDRKRSEEERLGLATAIEHAADAIILTDKHGKIEYINPATEKATGFGREELVGHNFAILRCDQHDDAFYKTMWTRITSGQVWSGHVINRIRDGSLCEFETKISPIKDTFGNVIRYVSVNRDVTQEIKLEKQIRQTQKMEAIGTLAGGIAHDFNNILAAILGYTELTRSTMPQGTPEYRNLEQVIIASYRARDLVQQILLFSRQGVEELKPVRVSDIVKEALQLLRATLPSTIEIRQSLLTSSESRILADPTQIHQVLMNLGTNAAHAMREKGGILDVSLSEIGAESDLMSLPELKPGPYILLTVSDTGHGMDRGVLDRIFDPFFTTKKLGEGTGMGLSVVHGIVKRHGGTLSVSSQVGQGTVFHLFFPRIDAARKDSPESLSVVSRGKGRILFVDDEQALVELVQQILEYLGYEVIARTNPMEALELFRSQPDLFDLVITDYTMPHMTGVALAKEILKIRPDAPIILCTGYNEMVTEENARLTGVREFIMKPVTINELSKKVSSALDKG